MNTFIALGVPRIRRAVSDLEAFLDEAHGGGDKVLERACLSKPPLCPRCPGAGAYRLGGGRFGCARCEGSFHLFTGRWLDRHALSATQWLTALKGFELGLDERSLGAWAELTPATAHRVYRTIRRALIARAQSHKPPLTALPAAGSVGRRGVSARNVVDYLQEREIRRQLAGRSLFLFLLDAVASYVPASDCRAKA